MNNKLVKKAQTYRSTKKSGTFISDDLIQLSLEWVKGGISNKQFQFAIGESKGVQIYVDAARALRQAFKEGKLIIKK